MFLKSVAMSLIGFSLVGCTAPGHNLFLPKIVIENQSRVYLTSDGYVHDDGRGYLLGQSFSHCPVVDTYTKRVSRLMQRDEVIQVWVRDCRR